MEEILEESTSGKEALFESEDTFDEGVIPELGAVISEDEDGFDKIDARVDEPEVPAVAAVVTEDEDRDLVDKDNAMIDDEEVTDGEEMMVEDEDSSDRVDTMADDDVAEKEDMTVEEATTDEVDGFDDEDRIDDEALGLVPQADASLRALILCQLPLRSVHL